ncbi:hypothetical protein BGX33_004787, partial [Mortierella sp. NVP41]
TASQPCRTESIPSIPVVRHHKRSVDRVLPPALEVRLARLTFDEGDSKRAHIIPTPPSLPIPMGISYSERDYNQASSLDNNYSDSLESIIEGTPSTYTNRLGKLGSSPDKSMGHHSNQLSTSMSSLQAPSALFQLDQQHQQHYHQPNIGVQYHRRNRSGSQLLGDSRGNNRTTDSGAPFCSPLLTQKPDVYTASPMTMETTGFGGNLFHWNTLEPDNSFFDSSTPQQNMANIHRPHRPHPHRQSGIYECNSDKNESVSSLDEKFSTPPTIHSPSRKGPLLAASSPAASPRSRSPLRELSEDTVQMRDQLLELPQGKASLDLRIDAMENSTGGNNYLDIPEMDDDLLPPGLPMSLGAMSNDQDRWRSPTLSALASRSSSRGPSPRPLSPSLLSKRSTMVMAMPVRHGCNVDRSESADMSVEIPVIETHDEVSLQDIWRMEDEERKDRLNGVATTDGGGESTTEGGSNEEYIATMKGEQHAHEEARLVQEAIDAHSQAL